MAVDPNINCEKVKEDEQGFPEYRYCDPATPLSEEFLRLTFLITHNTRVYYHKKGLAV